MNTEPGSSDPESQRCVHDMIAEANDAHRRRWACLLRSHHFEPVVFDILSNELPKYTNSSTTDPTDIVTHMRECTLILASAPNIFFAAVEGTLVSRMISDTDLQAEYEALQQRAYHQPSIYVHLLGDEDGQPPSPAQYLIIHDMLQDYLSDNPSEHAQHIDNITTPFIPFEDSAKGHRKYLSTPRTTRSPKRITTLQRLCTGISDLCAQIPLPLHSRPLPYSPSEVGYALNAHKRLAQHRAHHSSNATMNLVEDICTYLSRMNLLPKHFKMHQFIIYLIFRPSQASIAEIFCSGLLQCWVELGGFNAYPAGRSVASSRRVGQGMWQRFGSMAREGSALEGNMRVLRARAEAWRKALDWKGDGKDTEDREEARDGEDILDGESEFTDGQDMATT